MGTITSNCDAYYANPTMGTDDRAIRQYIETQSRILKRGRGVRKIYYLIISSSFSDEFDDLIGALKMETNVDEVCLVEVAALVAMVDQKLRAPLTVGLGPDGLQRLFTSGGIIKRVDDVQVVNTAPSLCGIVASHQGSPNDLNVAPAAAGRAAQSSSLASKCEHQLQSPVAK